VRILISTGEVSGDVAGALVARSVLGRAPEAELYGIGGSRLAAAGVEILRETNLLGCVGFTETFSAIPALAGAFRDLSRAFARRRPQVALLVGNDLFNCLLARWLRRAGVRTVCYFPPQVWLWRSLARPIGASYDAVLTSFPEEDAVYRARGARAHFVGHYLCDRLPPLDAAARAAARSGFGVGASETVVALLPGSRTIEVRELGPILVEGAARLLARDPALRFLLPLAEPRFSSEIAALVARQPFGDRIAIVTDGQRALAAADLALMASGTASLEATLLGVPMVLLYRLSRVTMAAVGLIRALGLIDAQSVGLPNLLTGAGIVPELRQGNATAERLADAAWALLADPARRAAMRDALGGVRPLLARDGTIDRVADCLLAHAEGLPWPVTGATAAAANPELLPSWSHG
jgi:lipid-A-disaccharide synthase